ncbi:MAG: hypothetical protein COV67_10535 [Nitrospinae bacterium CG11_big_fil_rev_8_21_14_0_20_56_8]|nr:MAG: hypothetical protein COV67_10535 [Nitrospinae bacterium CG11_big_fil_rev_8_21_14_0_20_56_8]
MQFDILSNFVENLISNVGDLSDEQKRFYVPQVTTLLEERIGLEMLPKLSEAHMEKYTELLERESTTADEWKTFWEMAIPNFQGEIEKILVDFAKEAKEMLSAGGEGTGGTEE